VRILHYVPAALISLAAAIAIPALADPTPLLFLAGTDVSPTSTYTSIGLIASFNGDLGKSGSVVRLWGDRLTYDFQSGGTRIGATSWGQSISLGYQWVDKNGFETAYAGYDNRTTDLSPVVPSQTLGTKDGARFEVDTTRAFGSLLHASAIGSLTTATHDYWTRVEILTGASTHAMFGPLFVLQGNPDYHGFRSGFTLENMRLTSHIATALAVGTQRINGAAGVFTSLSLSVTP
jgi:hypothetical protein